MDSKQRNALPLDPQLSQRQRAVDALLMYAALDDDPGNAGFCEGIAWNFAHGEGPGRTLPSEPYIEGIEAAVELLLLEVQGVSVSGRYLSVRRLSGVGCSIGCASPAHAAHLASQLMGVTA